MIMGSAVTSTKICPSIAAVILLLGLCHGPTVAEVVNVGLGKVVGEVSERYLSVALGSSLIRERWKNWDFSCRRLRTLAAGLSPAHLRLGGTDADFLIFKPESSLQNDLYGNRHPDRNRKLPRHVQLDSCDGWRFCKPKYHTNYTMTADDWDNINEFSKTAGWRLLFDFNVFLHQDSGQWSTQNAKALLDYSSKKGFIENLDFELGNEPNAYYHNFNFSISGKQLGQDFIELSKLVRKVRKGTSGDTSGVIVGPDVTRPRGKHSKSLKYLKQFLPVAKDVVDAVTWHQYYVNGRTSLLENFTDPAILDLLKEQLREANRAVRSALVGSNKKVWMGETSSAWGGGAKGLSDTYVAGFMWLDKLGLAAVNGVDTVIRQTFFGGHYALLDNSLQPRPDYWLSLLYKRFVGRRVISTITSNDSDTIRLYAHCTNTNKSNYSAGSITLYGMNLKDTDVTLNLVGDLANRVVDQYLLSPHIPGKLTSALMRLNGKTLKMLDDETFPPLQPRKIQPSAKITLPSKTFGYFVVQPTAIRSRHTTLCGQ